MGERGTEGITCASESDLLNERRRHVSLHHLVLGGLNGVLAHLKHTHTHAYAQRWIIVLSLAAATQEILFVITINSLRGERVCINSHLFQPYVHIISLKLRGQQLGLWSDRTSVILYMRVTGNMFVLL